MKDLPIDFWHGIDLFNQQDFFNCHEVLEDVWRGQADPERILTQGIIQIAVAFYHAGRANFVGAEKLLIRGLPRIETSLGLDVLVDVRKLLGDANIALESIQACQVPAAILIRHKPENDSRAADKDRS